MKKLTGKLVVIDFVDHCENLDAPLPCRVAGFVRVDHPNYIVVDCWLCQAPDAGTSEANRTSYCVVRKCVSKITEYCEK